MLQRNQVVTLFIMSVLTLICVGTALSRTSKARAPNGPSKPVQLIVKPEVAIGIQPHILGEASAPYVLVEFADYQCPPCGAINKPLTQTLEKYRGKLAFAYRNFPLPFHTYAKEAAIAAECAASEGKFWQIHDAQFEHQQELNSQKIQTIFKQFDGDTYAPKSDHRDRAEKRVQADIVHSAERAHRFRRKERTDSTRMRAAIPEQNAHGFALA